MLLFDGVHTADHTELCGSGGKCFRQLYQHGVTECFGEPCNTHLDTLYGFCRWLPIACHIVAQLLAVDARSFRQACKGKRRIFEERHRVKNILKFQTIEIDYIINYQIDNKRNYNPPSRIQIC